MPGGCGSGRGSEVRLVRSGFGARGEYSLRGHGKGQGSEICVVLSGFGVRGEHSLGGFRSEPGSETGLVRSEVGVRGEYSFRGFRSGRSSWGFCLVCLSPALRAADRSRADSLASRLTLPCHGGRVLNGNSSVLGRVRSGVRICGEKSLRVFRRWHSLLGFCLVCHSPALRAADRSRAGASASRLSLALPRRGGSSTRVHLEVLSWNN